MLTLFPGPSYWPLVLIHSSPEYVPSSWVGVLVFFPQGCTSALSCRGPVVLFPLLLWPTVLHHALYLLVGALLPDTR